MIKKQISQLITPFALATALFVGLVGALLVTPQVAVADCGGAQTSILNCDASADPDKAEDSGLWWLLLIVVNILTAGVGVLALAGIIYGSILYTSAGGNQEQVKKAMGIFTNVAIGVIAFALMFSVLNFLVPGGVFNP